MPTTDPPLLALLLLISTSAGPRFIFHYPPHPSSSPHISAVHRTARRPRALSLDTTSTSSFSLQSDLDTDTAASSTEDDWTSEQQHPSRSREGSGSKKEGSRGTTNGGTIKSGSGKSRVKFRTLRGEAPEEEEIDEDGAGTGRRRRGGGGGTGSDGYDGGGLFSANGAAAAEWESVLGYSTEGLEKLLCPGREGRKKRFEVGLGELVFLGCPVYVRDEGDWRKKRGRRQTQQTQRNKDRTESSADRSSDQLAAKASFNSGGMSEMGDAKSTSTSSGIGSNEMNMYHVVFVMNPQPLEYQQRVDEMYAAVVKKFAKALKYEQARSGYVWTEAKRITELKAKGKEKGTPSSMLWPTILQESHLAQSIAHIYDALSVSKIAHILIGETVDIILQLPQPMLTSLAPTPADPGRPGLWLTTTKMIDENGSLDPHSGLLLLQDKETILKEIEHDNRELAAPLVYFIRELTPTKSLQKMAIRHSLRLQDLQLLARHLISWRRAFAIPPLHVRDIYIVSPLADMKNFAEARQAFETKFPGLPSLAKMLQSLSARPLPYGYLIPSQDHKPAYMEILAWLLRGRWVTQLRTFAWVRVSVDIKARAAILARREAQQSVDKFRKSQRASTASGFSGSGLERIRTNDSVSEDGHSGPKDNSNVSQLLSPLIRPVADASKSDSGSVGSNRTTVPFAQNPGPSRLHHMSTPEPPSPFSIGGGTVEGKNDASNTIPQLELSPQQPSLILTPAKASAEESRWLAVIKDSLSSEELKSAWSIVANYFDGHQALEDIAAREGMKRSRVANIVAQLEHEGILCIVRHW